LNEKIFFKNKYFKAFFVFPYSKQMEAKKNAKNAKNFECVICDFSTSKESNFKIHMMTSKHLLSVGGNILETKNAGFFGTSCTAGSGKGICIRTGDATVIGQIANLASSAETNETPI
jgi:magnesium-transporting ATPase (P-type)